MRRKHIVRSTRLNRSASHLASLSAGRLRRRCLVLADALESRRLLSGGPADATLDFSGGFADPTGLTINSPAAIGGSDLVLSGGTSASAWSVTPRDVTQFQTSFSFRNANPGSVGRFSF